MWKLFKGYTYMKQINDYIPMNIYVINKYFTHQIYGVLLPVSLSSSEDVSRFTENNIFKCLGSFTNRDV